MTHWNYRIIHDKGCHAIHTVHYDRKGNPHSWSELPVVAAGESPTAIAWMLVAMAEALTRPVLELSELLTNQKGTKP